MNNNGLRFVLGEVAIFRVAAARAGIPLVGKQCTVEYVGPFMRGNPIVINGIDVVAAHDGDYMINFGEDLLSTEHGAVRDWQLRKLNPPEEPKAMQHRQDSEKLASFM